MKRKNRNNFGKRKIEESRGEFVIPSEPVRRGIDNLKNKYFSETSYENSYPSGVTMNSDDYKIPVKKLNINNNNINSRIPQSFYTNQFNSNQNNLNQNPHYSAEYKINNNNSFQANNNMQNNNGFNNMISFGGYNPIGLGNMPGMNNVSNFIRPMGVNPFAPPTFANNPNMNFGGLNNNFVNNNANNNINNSIFHSNHNLFNNAGNQNENDKNQ